MTEEEAKKKWCSHRQVRYSLNCIASIQGAILGASQTKDSKQLESILDVIVEQQSENNTNCIASKCMMWRWEYPKDKKAHKSMGIDKNNGYYQNGFCGLAGKL
jgi:predicted adenine nucleotide alpha hydrolase (AANH) superfamily ATPase